MVMLVGACASEAVDSDPDSNRRIWCSCATSAAASSSSLGVPRCLRAQAMRMISLIWLTYVSPWWTVFRTLVMAARMAWFVVASSVMGMAAWTLPSGVRIVGQRRGTSGMGGGMFSWSESLSSLGVGSSGCGKSLSRTWTKLVGAGFCTRS